MKKTYKDILILLIIVFLPLQVLMFLTKNINNDFLNAFFFGLAILALLYINSKKRYFNTSVSFKNLKLTSGFYVVVASIIFFLLGIFFSNEKSTPTAGRVFAFLTITLFSVVFEEILFRGFIQNKIVADESLKYKSIVKASMIFGLVHFLNILGDSKLVISTITQVMYATLLGISLGVSYSKSRNILTPIILHLIFNLLAGFTYIYETGKVTQSADIPIFIAIIQIIIMLPNIYFSKKAFEKK